MFTESFSVMTLLKSTPVCGGGRMVKWSPALFLCEVHALKQHIPKINDILTFFTAMFYTQDSHLFFIGHQVDHAERRHGDLDGPAKRSRIGLQGTIAQRSARAIGRPGPIDEYLPGKIAVVGTPGQDIPIVFGARGEMLE